MKRILFVVLGIGLMFGAACRSPQYFERVTDLQKKSNKLNHSRQYLSEMSADELKEVREEVTLVLLEEGETQLKSAQMDLNEEGLRRAKLAFQMVKAMDDQEYDIQDLEIVQTWRAMKNFAWGDCRHGDVLCRHECRGVWNIVKLALPVVWPYTLAETTVCFVADVIAGYESVEGKKISLSKLDKAHIARADFGIKEVDRLVIEKQNRNKNK